MWTADWWWEIQVKIASSWLDTLAPIIISTDKTQLTRFSGDQQAWPVYLTVGNIEKETQRSLSLQVTILIGYIPVTKLEIFSKAKHSTVAHQLFHDCMRVILEPLRAAGVDGETMDSDYLEQYLVACCRENSCPRCLVKPKQKGEPINSTMRNPGETLQVIIVDQSQNKFPVKFVDQNLRPINPFWADFPHCDIFSSMTPDLLHELHNGVFGDHIVKWLTQAITSEDGEVDRRFRAMTPHPSLRHFAKGISLTSQWTGNERKHMEKVFLGILAQATDPAVQRAVAAILDFIYYAHFETHCDESLARLDASWAALHDNKSIFLELKICKNFNINKLHKLKHYVDLIRSRGTADGFNTENMERLHIDFAKAGYRATNKVRYTRQMTVWLARQEAVYRFGTYLEWAVPGYVADPTATSADSGADGEDNDEKEGEAAPPPNDPDGDDKEELDDTPLSSSSSYRLDENSTFPVFKRFSISLPRISEVTAKAVHDTIRAVQGEPGKMTIKGVLPAKEGQFDTVLTRKDIPDRAQHPTEGISVARVRVIFRLPESYGSYPHPLAYVDWYKPLKDPVPNIRMHKVSLSSRNHHQNSSIIPITDILRSCHLIPVFGKSTNPTWTLDLHVLFPRTATPAAEARRAFTPSHDDDFQAMVPIFQWQSPEGHALAQHILRASPLPYDPHDYQIEGVCCSLDGVHLLAITPTGSGKTGYYMMYMLIVLAVLKDPTLCPTAKFPVDPCLVVISPTIPLQLDMAEKMRSVGLSAIAINNNSREEAFRLRNEELWVTTRKNINIILAGPEQLKSDEFEKALRNDGFYARICGTGFDEVHLLNTWGAHFRQDFQQMGFLKARMTEKHNPWILTTATLRDGAPYNNVLDLLGLIPGRFHLIRRSNLRPDVQMLFRDFFSSLDSGVYPDLD
ncbi:hypothetical protein MVEN_01881400 [Mycena venus]|uniref:Helicase ATP-binding domain-containing protein n=1 Tax=Mycena venus TaxID=2733690 RepID=A0A8H7CMJ3_9AGAR|nr:hypothetical protein MVEN_01881400 [Mycena venus]